MHPVIRILNLLVLAALAPWLPPLVLLATALLLLLAGLLRSSTGTRMIAGVRRVRWLLLSLMLLFLWFTPGEPLFVVLGSFSPTWQGVQMAAHRVGVLLVMVWAAAVLLGGLRPPELTGALRRLLLGPLRTPVTERFAERVGLLIAELPIVETRVRAALQEKELSLSERAARLFVFVENHAQPGSQEPVAARPMNVVPRPQWLLPMLILIVGVCAANLSG